MKTGSVCLHGKRLPCHLASNIRCWIYLELDDNVQHEHLIMCLVIAPLVNFDLSWTSPKTQSGWT